LQTVITDRLQTGAVTSRWWLWYKSLCSWTTKNKLYYIPRLHF